MPTQTDAAVRFNRDRWRILGWHYRALKQKYVYNGRFVYILYAVQDTARMNDDPFRWVNDAPLFIVPRTLDALRRVRAASRPDPLPAHLATALEGLIDHLLAGIEAHPTRFWVLKQVQPLLASVRQEDIEVRTQVGRELERLLGVLGIGRADGLFAHYLGI